MKKFMRTILTSSAVATGLVFAGAMTANADTTYTVKSGDCVWAIAQEFGSTIDKIETKNNIHGHLILPGQQLTIPTGKLATTSAPTPVYHAPASQAPVSQAPVSQAPASQAPASQAPVSQAPASQASQAVINEAPQASAPVASQATTSNESYTGDNMKSYVLGQMESRTGVSASTWDHIINRESNWQPGVRNSSSGAYGLFQNMHINGGSVEEQVNAAVNLYNVQGMQAWAL
ncbi:LysM peptidoglycan-binding domain-containing protein [Lactiplantibacillus fabifermentans]|uniref:Peptidoglycan-binding protein n=2 Tax=Lactiplantibacillus fabifermentans TaxID=483011 RepID=W6TBH0_9LACO|nr:LysM peptidoglycan-binding domain-containing protein [Lactiplantibacillus fabifermentans]ETY72625.1 peptidoglycan-binding protein [Lactiplantibacillus fabifermentans T30PCM01]